MENDNRNGRFSNYKWWFSIAMLVYQKVTWPHFGIPLDVHCCKGKWTLLNKVNYSKPPGRENGALVFTRVCLKICDYSTPIYQYGHFTRESDCCMMHPLIFGEAPRAVEIMMHVYFFQTRTCHSNMGWKSITWTDWMWMIWEFCVCSNLRCQRNFETTNPARRMHMFPSPSLSRGLQNTNFDNPS